MIFVARDCSALLQRPVRLGWLLSFGVCVGICGCAGPRQEIPAHTTTAPEPRSVVDYQFLVDENQGDSELPANWQIDAPRIVKAPLPVYPEQAKSDGDSATTIAVKFQVRTDGTVANISETQLEASSGGSSTKLFRSSVESALRDWEFTPGVVRIFEPGPDHDGDGNPDYRIQARTVPISIYYHVRFHFRMVDGVGQVEMDRTER